MSAVLLPLDAVKALLGITDTASDAALTAALPVVTAYFENHCKRGLAYVADVVEEQRVVPVERLPLFRFPVDVVTEFLVDTVAMTPPVPPQLDRARGFIYPHTWFGATSYPVYGWPTGVARVIYSGGYLEADMPADLAMAFARCCADFGGVSYSGGASTGGGAPLKSLGLGSGALTVSFDTGAQAQSAYDTSAVPPLLAPYLFVLDSYTVKDYV